MTNKLKQRLWVGALQGFQVLFWYAFAEYAFIALSFVLRPMLMRGTPQVMLLPQWRGTFALFGFYILIGILAGMATALFVRQPDPGEKRVRQVLVLALLLAFALNSAFHIQTLGPRIGLVTVALVTGAVTFFNIWTVAESPGLLFGALMCAVWVIASDRLRALSPVTMVLIAIVSAVLPIAAMALFRRVLAWFDAQYSWGRMLGNAAKVAGVLAISFGVLVPTAEVRGNAPAPTAQTVQTAQRPNILLVVLDTVRADHMSAFGYSRSNTPRLQSFANESTTYTNFISAAPFTLPSHASIFTGLYPQSHGAYKSDKYENGRPLATNIPTLAQLLTSNGYRTTAVAANKYYLAEAFGVLRGFEVKHLPYTLVLADPGREYLLRNRLRGLLRIDGSVRDLDMDTMPAEEVTRHAFQALDEFKRQDSPFFLFLNYMDAHAPYLPPAPYNRLYPGLDLGMTQAEYNRVDYEVNTLNHTLDSKPREHYLSQYDGAIAYLDANMGDLIDRLKKNGQFDRTMIIITSDHGEAFGERNVRGHNASVYQDEVHVPLFVKYAGQTQPERVDSVASNVDLMPTILDRVGVGLPAGLQGIDLQKIKTSPERTIVTETHGASHSDMGSRFRHTEWALYSGKLKLIYSTEGSRQLYDLSVDPGEHHNLYRADAPEVAELRTRLLNWSSHTTPRFLDAGPNTGIEEQLKSLGYAHQGVK